MDVVHDLPEDQKQCQCGNTLECIGEEVGVEQLAIIPAKHYVIRHIKKKYACGCGQCIKRAQMPLQPIHKSQASPILLAYLMVSKFIDGLPLYRLEKIAARDGLEVSRKNMARWLIKSAHWFERLFDRFERQLSSYDIAYADETWTQVLKEPGRDPTSKSWLWIRRGGPPDKPVVMVDYDSSRGSAVANQLFADYHNGYLVADAYAGYKQVIKDNNLIFVACHDHARRKFSEAYESLTKAEKQFEQGIAKQAIKRYKALYRIERNIKGKSAEQIKAARQKLSLPLLHEFKQWLELIKRTAVMTEKTQTAANYFLNQFDALCVYCTDGRLPIANIKTEHVAKTIAVARKNYLFAITQSGANTSAMIYSMIITAQANGLEPLQYLTCLLMRLPQIKANESIDHLLPWNLTSDQLRQMYDTIPRP